MALNSGARDRHACHGGFGVGGGCSHSGDEGENFGCFEGFCIGHEDDVVIAHLQTRGEEIAAGIAEIDGKTYDVREETMLLIGRGLQHKVTNTGSEQMRLIWFISPAGLEDWFGAIGRPRKAGDPLPPAFDRPANIREIQAQQRFIPSEEG